MLAAIAAVTLLAWWDEQREGQSALEDLGREQAHLAWSMAGRPEASIQRPGELVVLLADTGGALRTADGRVVSSPTILGAIERGLGVVRVPRAEAAQIGLSERTAMAGIARVDSPAGRHVVAVVATAARERDREARARWRLLLSVLVASGLVVAFGGVALANQRKELHLERQLAIAQVQREQDERLLEVRRVATMGTFAMGIVHEVSTPLGVIAGRAEQLLARLRGDDRMARGAQTILDQVDEIQRTIRRFLDLARGGPPSFTRADPVEVVRTVASSVEHRFAKAGVGLTTDSPPAMSAIQCDRMVLEHALAHLLLHACEACPRGGCVALAVRADEQ
jgi:signal transduction histidine kinase